ncbi:MAG TPA: hypothetical protein VN669_06495 [Candidatus Acidoferrales bacterium]|nr:hypothetical protein [Candidatus Acidoferrales bacterium]
MLAFQTLLGLASIGTAAALLVAARTASAGDSSDVIAAAIMGFIGVFVLICCWGLWKGRNWAWRLGFFMNLAGFVTFVWDPVSRRVKPDSDELGFLVLFGTLAILFMLAPVRKFYFRRQQESVNALYPNDEF